MHAFKVNDDVRTNDRYNQIYIRKLTGKIVGFKVGVPDVARIKLSDRKMHYNYTSDRTEDEVSINVKWLEKVN